MHREVVDGPYRIVVNADRKFDPHDPAHIVGYTVRVTVDRIDRRPVQGSMLTERSDEMVPLHGDHFLTVDAALEHGEAWGRHCIAQWRGSNRH